MTMRVRFLAVSFVLTGLVVFSPSPTAAGLPPHRSFQAPQKSALRAVVTAVYDGDTVKVRFASGEESRVRLIGVDSPEFDDDRENVRMLAFLAKRFCYLRLYGKDVRLTFGPELHDAYGRLLAFVWFDDRVTFNETLIREGYAFAFFKFPFDAALTKKFKEAEAEARKTERGLWRSEPWPLIGPGEAGRWEGKIVTIRFLCVRVHDRGRFRILDSGGAGFQAVFSRDLLALLPGPLAYQDRTIRVTGIVEDYRGNPQIMIGLPSQLEVLEIH
jgi:micrococcal nuclease